MTPKHTPEDLFTNLVQTPEETTPRPKRVFRIKNGTIVSFEKEHEQEPPNTYIMRWNPSISNYKMEDFENDMDWILDEEQALNWSIWDYQDAKIGDRFFMLKVGTGRTGIVMEGTIVSAPYRDEDWSGRGREVYYVYLKPNCIIHPERSETMLTTEQLSEQIPEVHWNEGHSGEKLSRKQAIKLSTLWEDHLMNTPPDLL